MHHNMTNDNIIIHTCTILCVYIDKTQNVIVNDVQGIIFVSSVLKSQHNLHINHKVGTSFAFRNPKLRTAASQSRNNPLTSFGGKTDTKSPLICCAINTC